MIMKSLIALIGLVVLTGIVLYREYPFHTKTIANPSIEEKASQLQEACNEKRQQNLGKYSCYAKELSDIAFQHGSDYAFKVLFAVQKKDLDAKNCHFIAHGIGWGAYKRNPDDWQNLIATSSASCSYGSQMGAIEAYAENSGNKITKEFVPTICGPNPKSFDCNHAVGHVLLVETQGDKKEALELCYGIQTKIQRFACLSGLFMEHMLAFGLADHGIVPESRKRDWPNRIEEFEKLCREYEGDEAVACWREISHVAFAKFQHDPKKIFDFCNRSHVNNGAGHCKRHALAEIAGSRKLNLSSLKDICAIGQSVRDPEFEKDCYLQLVGIKLNFVPAKEARDVVDFCSSLDEEFRSSCFERLCRDAPEEFKDVCFVN